MLLKPAIFILFPLTLSSLFGQPDTNFIQIHFWYGSKPLHSTRKTEKKYFGGLHGGHVTIEVDSVDYGFNPKEGFHIFPHKKNINGFFEHKQTHGKPPYREGTKFVTFVVPLTPEQYEKINEIHSNYCRKAPYDYAFLGMRCATATQDILGQIGVVPYRNRISNILSTFYPKKLRKRMFRLAKEKNYKILKQEGRATRKWEKD